MPLNRATERCIRHLTSRTGAVLQLKLKSLKFIFFSVYSMNHLSIVITDYMGKCPNSVVHTSLFPLKNFCLIFCHLHLIIFHDLVSVIALIYFAEVTLNKRPFLVSHFTTNWKYAVKMICINFALMCFLTLHRPSHVYGYIYIIFCCMSFWLLFF